MRQLTLLAVAWLAAACIGGGAPSNGIVQVTNESADQVTFAWSSPGLFGNLVLPDTGQDIIDGCSVYARSFGPGLTTVNIWHGKDSIELSLALKKSDEEWHYVVVDPSGAVAEVAQAIVPAQPCASP